MTSGSADRDSPSRPGPPRSGWEVLDAARASVFTGALEFALDPTAHVYFERGEVYLAECDGDPPVGARLVAAGVLSVDDLDGGTVIVAGEAHLGRLFERVPTVDRAAVLVALEMLSGETVAWVAAQRCQVVVSRPYVQHPSGVNRWYTSAAPISPQLPAPLPAPGASGRPLRGWHPPRPSPEPSGGGELRIEWLDRDVLAPQQAFRDPLSSDAPSGSPSTPTTTAPAPSGVSGSEPTTTSPPAPGGDVATEDDATLERFQLLWPSGEIGFASASSTPITDDPEVENEDSQKAALVDDPEPPTRGSGPSEFAGSDTEVTSSRSGAVFEDEDSRRRVGSPDDGAEVGLVTDQMRLAVRRTVSAIEEGLVRGQPIDAVVPVPDDLVDPFDRWGGITRGEDLSGPIDRSGHRPTGDVEDADPFAGWSASLPPDSVESSAVAGIEDPYTTEWFGGDDSLELGAEDLGGRLPAEQPHQGATRRVVPSGDDEDEPSVRRGTLSPRTARSGFGSSSDEAERKTALQRLIDGIRGH